jgi:hypothetical protein
METEKEKDWINRMHKIGGISGPDWRRQDVRNILLFCEGDRHKAEHFILEQGSYRIPMDTLTFILFSRILALEERIEYLEYPGKGLFDD